MRCTFGALGAALLLLTSAPVATASLQVREQYSPDAKPVLGIDPGYRGAAEWYACTPTCGEQPVGTGTQLIPGAAVAGTHWEVHTEDDQGVSETWGGVPAFAGPPTWQGTPTVGQTITAAPAPFSGGWPGSTAAYIVRTCFVGLRLDDICGRRYMVGNAIALNRDDFGRTLTLTSVLTGPDGNSSAGRPTPQPTPSTYANSPTGPLASTAPGLGPILWTTPPAAPKVGGKLVAGKEVRLVLGNSPDVPSGLMRSALRACPTPQAGPECVLIGTFRTEFERKVKLPATKAGWYVGAVEALFLPVFRLTHKAIPAPGPTVFFAPLSARPIGLSFTPRVKLRSTALDLGDGRVQLGTISCRKRCTAHVSLGGRAPQTVEVSPGDRRITIRRRRGSTITVKVTFDHSDVVRAGVVRLNSA